MSERPAATGRCLCGAVRYEVTGPLRPVITCHCEQCRRTSGHFVAATATRPAHLRLVEDRGLRWYRSSAAARRGFCGECGGSLFWQPDHGRRVSIMAGTLDRPTGLALALHIYADAADDYYRIQDDVPCLGGGGHGIDIPEG